MFKRFFINLLLCLFLIQIPLFSYTKLEDESDPHYRYTFSVCALLKNEFRYLREWVEYHRLFGVDHFYLYNIGNKEVFERVLRPYIVEGIITIVNWPEVMPYPGDNEAYKWALSMQIPAYENAVNFLAKNQTKWIVFIDTDEFLVCPQEDIKEILQKYDDFCGISLSTDYFDIDFNLKQKLLIETMDLIKPPTPVVGKSIAKMIFKPDLCEGFRWPPYTCIFKNQGCSIPLSKKELRVNRYLNRYLEYGIMEKKRPKLVIDTRDLPEEECARFLEEGYVIEDQERSLYHFVPKLMQKMGYK